MENIIAILLMVFVVIPLGIVFLAVWLEGIIKLFEYILGKLIL